MNTERLKVAYRTDIVALDSDGWIVLLVESIGGAAKQRALSNFQWDGANLSELITLKTAAVLSHYDPEFGSKPIFEPYLITLVDVWLRDLAYHWKVGIPPASEQLAAIGLLQRLEGGTTQTEVEFGGHTLR